MHLKNNWLLKKCMQIFVNVKINYTDTLEKKMFTLIDT